MQRSANFRAQNCSLTVWMLKILRKLKSKRPIPKTLTNMVLWKGQFSITTAINWIAHCLRCNILSLRLIGSIVETSIICDKIAQLHWINITIYRLYWELKEAHRLGMVPKYSSEKTRHIFHPQACMKFPGSSKVIRPKDLRWVCQERYLFVQI